MTARSGARSAASPLTSVPRSLQMLQLTLPPPPRRQRPPGFLRTLFAYMAAAGIATAVMAVLLLVLQILAIRYSWRSPGPPSEPAVSEPAGDLGG